MWVRSVETLLVYGLFFVHIYGYEDEVVATNTAEVEGKSARSAAQQARSDLLPGRRMLSQS